MTLKEAAALFKEGNDFIFTSHEAPDADGIGAEYALTVVLRSMGKRARAVNADMTPLKYRFIDEQNVLELLEGSGLEESDLSASTIVLADTNDIQYTGAMADLALSRAGRILVFDHHEAKGVSKDESCSVPDASSTCEMAYYVIKDLGQALTKDVASALFAGIVYDTGSFGYAKTGEATFKAALDLVRHGAVPALIHNKLYESSNTCVLLLRRAVLSTLELHERERVALQVMSKEMLTESGASYEDAEDLINIPLQSKTVEVSVFFKSNNEGVLRCSLRSKGFVIVAQLAQSFGGGGHKTAAGFKCPYPLETIRKKVLELIRPTLPD